MKCSRAIDHDNVDVPGVKALDRTVKFPDVNLPSAATLYCTVLYSHMPQWNHIVTAPINLSQSVNGTSAASEPAIHSTCHHHHVHGCFA